MSPAILILLTVVGTRINVQQIPMPNEQICREQVRILNPETRLDFGTWRFTYCVVQGHSDAQPDPKDLK